MAKRQQVTEVEAFEDSASPGSQGSVLSQPMPRWLTRTLLAVFVLLAVIGVSGFGRYHVYQKHFRETIADTPTRFRDLRPGMTDKEVMAMYPGMPWRCTYQDAAAGMGDWVCFSSLNTADGYPALTMGFFFTKKKLTMGLVHVPWWAHGRAQETMRKLYGPPVRYQGLLRWRMPDGTLDMNPARSFNPVWWSAIVWMPA